MECSRACRLTTARAPSLTSSMNTEQAEQVERRVLVLAPTGRDAELVRQVAARGGLVAYPCSSMEDVCERLEEGAGALLLAEETLTRSAVATLSQALRAQPTWSDVPIVV